MTCKSMYCDWIERQRRASQSTATSDHITPFVYFFHTASPKEPTTGETPAQDRRTDEPFKALQVSRWCYGETLQESQKADW